MFAAKDTFAGVEGRMLYIVEDDFVVLALKVGLTTVFVFVYTAALFRICITSSSN